MSHRSRTLRFALVFAGIASLIGTARATDDDFEFAQGLSNRGYQDLAEEQYNKILTDSKKSAKEKAEGQYGLALIKRYNALVAAMETSPRRREPMKKVLDLFSGADAALAQFIERNPSHPRVLEAKLDRSKLITDRADYIDRAIENGWVPSDVTESELKKQVAEGYDTAIKLLKDVEDEARAELDKCQPNTDEYGMAEDKLGIVWLFRIAALYGKGAALPDGDTAGLAALNQALSEIAEFMWLFDGTVRGLWAFHYSALCNWRLDSAEDAIRDMRDAASYVKEADGVPAARAIALSSYAKLGEIAIDVAPRHGPQYLATAAETFATLPQNWPTYMEDAGGQRAALSYARVLAAQDNGTEALALVQRVLKKAKEKGTGVDRDAGNVLGELLNSGEAGSVALEPGLLNEVALSKWKDEDYRGAIRAFQAVIRACETNAQKDEFAWNAWDYIGRCYGSMTPPRWYEAYLAFDAIEQAWAADKSNEKLSELTNESAYSRAASVDQLARLTSDSDEKARLNALSKQLLDEFATNHPDAPRNASADLRQAEELKRDADNLRREGDYAAALAKFEEARKAFQAVSKDSKQIDRVGATLAELLRKEALCHRGAGDDAKALAAYDRCIADSEAWLEKAKSFPNVVDSTVRRARENGKNIALTNILTSVSQRADVTPKDQKVTAFENVLKALGKYEADFVAAANRGQVLVDQWRIEALIGTGQIDKADELVSKLITENPDLTNGPYLAALVAAAREREADEWLKKGDKDKYKSLMTRASKLSEYAITKSGNTSPEALLALGNRYRKAGMFEKAEGFLNQAMEAFAAAGAPEKARAVRLDLIGLLVDQGKYEEAITPLEVELVGDPGQRKTVLDKLAKSDDLNTNDLKELLAVMSNNKRVLTELARAYLEAARNERDLLCSINLTWILMSAHPKDDMHDAEWVGHMLRLSNGYFKYAALTAKPEAYRAVVGLIENKIVTPGLLEIYDEKVPGSKREFERLLSEAKAKS